MDTCLAGLYRLALEPVESELLEECIVVLYRMHLRKSCRACESEKETLIVWEPVAVLCGLRTYTAQTYLAVITKAGCPEALVAHEVTS